MDYTDLKNEYSNLEKRIIPVKDFLENNKDKYRGLYKGIATVLSPLVYRPEILFLGINSGSGAYHEINQGKADNKTPLRMIGENEQFFKELNWYEKGNARWGGGGEWRAYEWYERNKNTHNSFAARMIDLLYKIAEKIHPDYKCNDNNEPLWKNDFGSKIMYTNLYPIMTDDIKQLKEIHKMLSKENVLKQLWKGENERVSEWKVRMFFINIIRDLIQLVQPKVIVCMGVTVFKDLTYTNKKTPERIFRDVCCNTPVVVFKRKGNWSGLIPDIAESIYELIK